MKTAIGISENNWQGVANVLARLLADEFVLHTKTKNVRWNIEGVDFYE